VDSTCWDVIRGAAEGRLPEREEFARRYETVIRAYLGARWRDSSLRGNLDDAAQDVFVDCFRDDGALTRADPEYPGGFRAFLYGVVRNVARRHEEKGVRRREARMATHFEVDANEESLSQVFDRAWAEAIMRQARRLQAARAREVGEAAHRRVELLRLRFSEDRPMREIAREWGLDANQLQYQYAKARDEFEAALCAVVRDHYPEAAVEKECARLLEYLA
jgi:RNA polymerase sigma-70 factor (ECF subfamily)